VVHQSLAPERGMRILAIWITIYGNTHVRIDSSNSLENDFFTLFFFFLAQFLHDQDILVGFKWLCENCIKGVVQESPYLI
jgi:hypothetical protein